MKYFRKIAASLLITTALSAHAATDLATAIAQSTINGTVTKVTLAPIPHDDAMMLTIHTTKGQYNIIVAKDYVDAAISLLSNPPVTGARTAVSNHIRQNPLVSAKLIAPARPIVQAVPASQLPPTISPQLTHASATIAVAATAANQQASK